jgi:hypothetical protein
MKLTAELDINQEQGRYEISTWLRMLDYQQQENVYMKTRIAEMVKHSVSRETLERLEHYQNLFLNKDTVIALLRRDIMQLADPQKGKPDVSLAQLRRDAQRMEQEFGALRAEFNSYVCTVVSS